MSIARVSLRTILFLSLSAFCFSGEVIFLDNFSGGNLTNWDSSSNMTVSATGGAGDNTHVMKNTAVTAVASAIKTIDLSTYDDYRNVYIEFDYKMTGGSGYTIRVEYWLNNQWNLLDTAANATNYTFKKTQPLPAAVAQGDSLQFKLLTTSAVTAWYFIDNVKVVVGPQITFDPAVFHRQNTLQLSAAISEPTDSQVSYQWSCTGRPAGAADPVIEPAALTTAAVTAGTAIAEANVNLAVSGNYIFKLRVVDSIGHVTEKTLEVDIAVSDIDSRKVLINEPFPFEEDFSATVLLQDLPIADGTEISWQNVAKYPLDAQTPVFEPETSLTTNGIAQTTMIFSSEGYFQNLVDSAQTPFAVEVVTEETLEKGSCYEILQPSVFTELTTTALAGSAVDEALIGYSTQNQNLKLPFDFKLYGLNYAANQTATINLRISTNGFIELGTAATSGEHASNHLFRLINEQNTIGANIVRIAPMWDDLDLSGTGNGMFIDKATADEFKVRWKGIIKATGTPCNFSVTLYKNGQILFDYGPGNNGTTPAVGISAGDGFRYSLVREYTSDIDPINLENARSIKLGTTTQEDLNADGIEDTCQSIKVFGFHADSPIESYTTGKDALDPEAQTTEVIFEGSGFVSGMAVTFRARGFESIAAGADVQASQDGSLLFVKVPSFAPGCDCFMETDFDVNVEFKLAAGLPSVDLFESTGQLFRYTVAKETIPTGYSGLQEKIDAAKPGTCLIFKHDYLFGNPRPAIHMGPITMDASDVNKTLTSDLPLKAKASYTKIKGQLNASNGSPNAPALKLSDCGRGVCISYISLTEGSSGIEITGNSSPVIKGCQIDDNRPKGGILVLGGKPVIYDCTIQYNETDSANGGGISVKNGAAYIFNNVIQSNCADHGGGISLENVQDDTVVANNVISANHYSIFTQEMSEAGNGGGIYISDCGPLIFGNTIKDHQITGNGGGIFISNGWPGIYANRIIGNVARNTASATQGGGIFLTAFNNDKEFDIWYNVIAENSAQWGGAIVLNNKNIPYIVKNLIFGNTARQYYSDASGIKPPAFAPGILVNEASFWLDHNVIYGNTGFSAKVGSYSGIYKDVTTTGGVHIESDWGLDIYSNILMNNGAASSTAGYELYSRSEPSYGIYNNIGFDSDGGFIFSFDDPMLLAENMLDNPDFKLPSAAYTSWASAWDGFDLLNSSSPAYNASDWYGHIGAVTRPGFVPECDFTEYYEYYRGSDPSWDRNANGYPDRFEILFGGASDENRDNIPDDGRQNDNINDYFDTFDLETGLSLDQDKNQVVDEHEGLLAYYTFDQQRCDVLRDDSGNGNEGTFVDFPAFPGDTAPWQPGLSANALTFDGVDDRVEIPAVEGLNLDKDFAISFWYKPAVFDSGCGIIRKLDSKGLAIGYSGGSVDVEIKGESIGTFLPIPMYLINETYEWLHVTVQRKNNTLESFVNGSFCNDEQVEWLGSVNSQAPLVIGTGGQNSSPLSGLMEDLRIYNRALSQEEIRSLAHQIPLVWLPMDDAAQTAVVKDAFLAHNGIYYSDAQPAVTWDHSVSGRFGKSIHFDGTAWIELPDFQGITGSNPRIVTAWIWCDKEGGAEMEIARWGQETMTGSAQYWRFFIRQDAVTLKRYLVLNAGMGKAESQWPLPVEEWCHVAVKSQKDTVDGISIHINGRTSKTLYTNPTAQLATLDTQNVVIGNGFIGNLDDFRIYDSVLGFMDLESFCKPVLNESTGKRYTTIYSAVSEASQGQTILLYPGTHYVEVPVTLATPINLQSIDPQNWNVIKKTRLVNVAELVSWPVLSINSSPTVRGLTFDGNSSKRSIAVTTAATPVISYCSIENGYYSLMGGAGIWVNGGYPLIEHCRLSNNSTSNRGAAVYISSSYAQNNNVTRLDNCLIEHNKTTGTGGYGAALAAYQSDVIITNCTIVDNLNAGGNMADTSAPVYLYSIAANNVKSFENNILLNPTYKYEVVFAISDSDTATLSHNCLLGRAPAANYFQGTTGQFVIENNFDVASIAEAKLDSDYTLLAGSPCIDRGTNTPTLSELLATDLNGQVRRIDDAATADLGSGTAPIVDIGCLEFVPPAQVVYDKPIYMAMTMIQDAFADLQNMMNYWLMDQAAIENNYYEGADKTRDGKVNLEDFVILSQQWTSN